MVPEDPCAARRVLNAPDSIRAGVPHFSYENYFHSPFPPPGTWGGIECAENGGWKFISEIPEFADTKNRPSLKNKKDFRAYNPEAEKKIKEADEKWDAETAARILADLGDQPDADTTRNAAVILWRIDNLLAAVDLIGKIPEKTPHDRFWEAYVLQYTHDGRKESVSKFKDILIDNPCAIAYHNLADACAGPGNTFCYLDEKEMSEIAALRKKAAAFPSCPPYAYAAYVVSVAVSTNRADDIAPLVRDALERAPEHADDLRSMLIAHLLLERRDTDALREIEAIFPDPKNQNLSAAISSMCIHARSNQIQKTKEHAAHAAKLLDDYRRKQQEQEAFGKDRNAIRTWVSAKIKIGDTLAGLRLEKEAVVQYNDVASIPVDRWAYAGRVAKASIFLARGAVQKAAVELSTEIKEVSDNPRELHGYDDEEANTILNTMASVISAKTKIQKKIRGTTLLAAYQILSEISPEELQECWPGAAEALQSVCGDHHQLLLEAARLIDVPNILLALTHWIADENPLFVRHFLLHLIEESPSIKTTDDINIEAAKHFANQDEELKFFEWLGGFGKKKQRQPRRNTRDPRRHHGRPLRRSQRKRNHLPLYSRKLARGPVQPSDVPRVPRRRRPADLLWEQNPWYLTLKCWVLNRMNRIEDAVAAGEAALKEDTEKTDLNTRSETRFHLANAYIGTGNPEKAIDLAQWAAANNPKSKKYKDFSGEVEKIIAEKREREKEVAKREQFLKTASQRYFGLDMFKKRLLATLHQVNRYENHEDLARLSGIDVKSIQSHLDALIKNGFLEFDEKGGYTINPHVTESLERSHIQVGATVSANPKERSNRPIFNSDGEKTLYRILTVTLPNFLVMPNVSLQAIFGYENMKTKKDDGTVTNKEFAYFLNSYADFCVVSTMTYVPVVCFELDSKIHDDPDRMRKDNMKDRLFEAGGVPLVRVRFYDQMDEQQARTEVVKAMQGAGILSGITV